VSTNHSAAGSLPTGVIVNADDLGIHPDISAGILSAYRKGILTSCTMLMTTAYLEQTVRDYVRPEALPIGIHLSLTLGKAAAPLAKVPDLVDTQGNLKLSASRLLISSFGGHFGRQLLEQIRTEFDAQLALARDWGLRPTHADSHQHVHMNPAIFSLVQDLLPRYGVTRLRFCREPLPLFPSMHDLPTLLQRLNPAKWVLLRWRAAQLTARLATNEDFFGVLHSGAMSKNVLMAIISAISPDRSVEICVHPGFPAPRGPTFYPRPGYNDFISTPARKVEHDILVDENVREFVRRRRLVLRAFDGRAKG
jgi:chitin disaccharide deacetylase